MHPHSLSVEPRPRSPVELTASVLRGRWSAPVVWQLFWQGKRFYQLLRDVGGVSRAALAGALEELERLGVVERRLVGGPLGRVEYQLTADGERLRLVIGAMYAWGLETARREGMAFGVVTEGDDEEEDVN